MLGVGILQVYDLYSSTYTVYENNQKPMKGRLNLCWLRWRSNHESRIDLKMQEDAKHRAPDAADCKYCAHDPLIPTDLTLCQELSIFRAYIHSQINSLA